MSAKHHAAADSVTSDSGSNNTIILASSVVVASIILSITLFFTAGTLAAGIDKVASAYQGGVPSVPSPSPVPTPTQVAPSPTPEPTANLKGLEEGGHVKGSDSAPVTIVEFSDLECPFCGRWYSDSYKQLKSEYIDTGKVRLVYKHFPLSFHPQAKPAALAVECAAEQNKFWELHDKIFENQTQLSDASLKQWAKDLGMNETQFNSCLDAKKYESKVDQEFSQGSAAGVGGTPSFFIGKTNGAGTLVVGAQPYSVFKQAIEAALTG